MRFVIFLASMLTVIVGAATLSGCSVAKCVVHSDRCN